MTAATSVVIDGVEENENLLLDVWNGAIPIEFSLSNNDFSGFERPHSSFVIASRLSYLPIVAKEIIEFYQSIAIDMCPNPWFEYEGIYLFEEVKFH
jgi:hypothetical protein